MSNDALPLTPEEIEDLREYVTTRAATYRKNVKRDPVTIVHNLKRLLATVDALTARLESVGTDAMHFEAELFSARKKIAELVPERERAVELTNALTEIAQHAAPGACDKGACVADLMRMAAKALTGHVSKAAPPVGIYVASRASIPERAAMWRQYRANGFPIISTWIDEDGPGQSVSLRDLWERVVREVASAERLVLYAESDDSPLKGAFIEVGIALGCGVPVFVVAPNVIIDSSFRPLGSWVAHPNVTMCGSLDDAFVGPSNAAICANAVITTTPTL